MEEKIREIIVSLGENPERPGLEKTPARVAKALRFMTRGYRLDPMEVINGAIFNEDHNDMVILKDVSPQSNLAELGRKANQPGKKKRLRMNFSNEFLRKTLPSPRVASRAPSNYLPDVSIGNETLLNTREYAYSSFFVRVKRQMEAIWKPRPALQKIHKRRDQYITVLQITLTRRGELEAVRLVQPSGNRQLDQEAMRTVRNSAPYLNPPDGLVEADGRIRIPRWYFIVSSRVRL